MPVDLQVISQPVGVQELAAPADSRNNRLQRFAQSIQATGGALGALAGAAQRESQLNAQAELDQIALQNRIREERNTEIRARAAENRAIAAEEQSILNADIARRKAEEDALDEQLKNQEAENKIQAFRLVTGNDIGGLRELIQNTQDPNVRQNLINNGADALVSRFDAEFKSNLNVLKARKDKQSISQLSYRRSLNQALENAGIVLDDINSSSVLEGINNKLSSSISDLSTAFVDLQIDDENELIALNSNRISTQFLDSITNRTYQPSDLVDIRRNLGSNLGFERGEIETNTIYKNVFDGLAERVKNGDLSREQVEILYEQAIAPNSSGFSIRDQDSAYYESYLNTLREKENERNSIRSDEFFSLNDRVTSLGRSNSSAEYLEQRSRISNSLAGTSEGDLIQTNLNKQQQLHLQKQSNWIDDRIDVDAYAADNTLQAPSDEALENYYYNSGYGDNPSRAISDNWVALDDGDIVANIDHLIGKFGRVDGIVPSRFYKSISDIKISDEESAGKAALVLKTLQTSNRENGIYNEVLKNNPKLARLAGILDGVNGDRSEEVYARYSRLESSDTEQSVDAAINLTSRVNAVLTAVNGNARNGGISIATSEGTFGFFKRRVPLNLEVGRNSDIFSGIVSRNARANPNLSNEELQELSVKQLEDNYAFDRYGIIRGSADGFTTQDARLEADAYTTNSVRDALYSVINLALTEQISDSNERQEATVRLINSHVARAGDDVELTIIDDEDGTATFYTVSESDGTRVFTPIRLADATSSVNFTPKFQLGGYSEYVLKGKGIFNRAERAINRRRNQNSNSETITSRGNFNLAR